MTSKPDGCSTYQLTQPFILWIAHYKAIPAPNDFAKRGGQARLSRSDPDQATLRQDTKPSI